MTENRLSLNKTLLTTARCLSEVESGRSLSALLSRVHPSERAAVQALSMYAMRHWGLAQAWRSIAMQRRSQSGPLNSLVALSLLLLDIAMVEEAATGRQGVPDSFQCPPGDGAPRYAVHTVVDQSVRAARLVSKASFAPRLLNAILRRFQRERTLFVEAVARDEVARWNYPAWWIAQVRDTYPDHWQSILQVSQTAPDLVLRVNQRRSSVQQVLSSLEDAGVQAVHVGGAAIKVRSAGAIERLPGFEAGWWSVQDLSAQQAAPLLGLRGGARVLDACSAPGGKAAHILELANVSLTAVDQDARRLEMVRENLERLGLLDPERVQLVHADLLHSRAWAGSAPFDLILADVPCTASGVVRRHPDIAWLRRQSDLEQTVALQRAIVDAIWPALVPGGRLLLATCSIFEQEGEAQAVAMLERHADARRLPAPGLILPESAGEQMTCGHDGFFYALFTKEARA
ncbi:16S rRNA (cytosine(967)-C(5))-methyltransferase RsmB [Orrella marina]|uniref:16S rRNA (Cytosine(967)-C(5))-methyltransferase RsmB n=1 Tax=Orrella marina TaxID=2163011 RepID=A0A2R4XMD7_9BURK|nr:16S rRNA (cytosine(967)-C(5))-methyltransferase RsmB [Orrella marina]AWB34977.1 16S rRNA (cytosine(967)-C(5))-methyltransferase RsmB [Orrella marina]